MAEKRELKELESSDPVISLQDVIDEDAELETTANAVLGGSNDQECTYSEGYLPRQALYACATCEITEKAGICLACSLQCHEGHELFELYTKRGFRCDCGNSKFPNLTCMLHSQKDPANQKNTYNQNFKGRYCTCKRPYPDPEDDVEDVMIQCVICEDWFHSRHLHGKGVPDDFDYAEMICHLCMSGMARILWFYNWEFTQHETSMIDVESVSSKQQFKSDGRETSLSIEDARSTVECNATKFIADGSCSISLNTDRSSALEDNFNKANDVENLAKEQQRQGSDLVTEFENSTTRSIKKEKASKELPGPSERQCGVSEDRCLLHRLMKLYESCDFSDAASFWPEGWREKLCQCSECEAMMKELSFLFKDSDSVAEYEAKGLEKTPPSSVSSGVSLLSGMSRMQQVEVIQGYNDMKAELVEYLRSFAQENRVVTEEDIRNFFQRMNESKRVKVDIPNSCR